MAVVGLAVPEGMINLMEEHNGTASAYLRSLGAGSVCSQDGLGEESDVLSTMGMDRLPQKHTKASGV